MHCAVTSVASILEKEQQLFMFFFFFLQFSIVDWTLIYKKLEMAVCNIIILGHKPLLDLQFHGCNVQILNDTVSLRKAVPAAKQTHAIHSTKRQFCLVLLTSMKMLYGGVLGIAGFNGTIRQKDLCLCSSLFIHSKKKIIATTSALFTVVYIV